MSEKTVAEETLELQNAKSKEQHVRELMKIVQEVEDQIEPFKEHLKELKKDYVEKEWLSKEDIKLAMKCRRLIKDEVTLEDIMETWQWVSGQKKIGNTDE